MGGPPRVLGGGSAAAGAVAGLGLISTPSTASLQSDLAGLSPRSTESQGLPFFVRASQLSAGDVARRTSSLVTLVLHLLASASVTAYDLLMRLVMPSWYLVDLHKFGSSAEYLHARAEKKTRRYVDSATDKFLNGLTSGQICLRNKVALEEEDFEFARSVFCGKHGKPWLLYAAWRAFVTLLSHAPYFASFSTVVDGSTGAVLAVFVEFRQGVAMHHFITALVDHEASKRHGIYVAKYDQMISACTQDGVRVLRMGPTTDALKASMGGVRFPLFVVDSPVWLLLPGRCSVVAFGIFTTAGLFAFMWLLQWQMDASGTGRLTAGEYMLMYGCCIAFVKALPLHSIGWAKVLSNPRKFLLQTSFYAQGVIFGGLVFIALASYMRGANPLRLLDALCTFAFVGDCVGRLGCHFYGCCFGRPILQRAAAALARAANPGGEEQQPAKQRPLTPFQPERPLGAPAAPQVTDLLQAKAQAVVASDPLSVVDAAHVLGGSSVDGGSSAVGGSSVPSSILGSGSDSDSPLAPPHQLRGPGGLAAGGGRKGAAAADAAALPGEPFHPLAVVYLDRASSISRLRPELRLKPLLPTQLLQALFAFVCQAALMYALWRTPTVKTGLVGCYVLALYSVGRAVFFVLREDENFKSNRSYTTAYIALGTLAASAALAVYVSLLDDATTFQLGWRPPRATALSYTSVAAATAGVNFLVQALHHHEAVGRFPDLGALFAVPRSAGVSPAPSLQRLSSGYGPRLSGRGTQQVFNNWGTEPHSKLA